VTESFISQGFKLTLRSLQNAASFSVFSCKRSNLYNTLFFTTLFCLLSSYSSRRI